MSDEIIVIHDEAPEPEKLSPLRAAMARLELRLNGRDRRELRRAQARVTGTKETTFAMMDRMIDAYQIRAAQPPSPRTKKEQVEDDGLGGSPIPRP